MATFLFIGDSPMRKPNSFNVIHAVRINMNIHGGRFIIYEFFLASLINLGVIEFSLIKYLSGRQSFYGLLWLIAFLGIFLNCITIMVLAIIISRREGNRPIVKEKINAKPLAFYFILYLLIPFLLFFAGWRQMKKR